MQNLSHQIRKDHIKKNIKTKQKSSCHHPLHSAFFNPSVVVKPSSPKSKPKKKKVVPKKSQIDILGKNKNKSNTYSAKRTQSTGVVTTRGKQQQKRASSGRKKSPSKMKKSRHLNKFAQYLQKPIEIRNLVAEGIETTKSFFPLSHKQKQVEESRQLKSYLVGESGSVVEHQDLEEESEGVTDSIVKAADLPFDSGFMGQIPKSFKDFYDKSHAVEASPKGMSKEEWEAVQTLKIKNQELNNYIQELEASQRKLQKEQEDSKKVLESQFQKERKAMINQINELRQEQSRLANTNATLQQMFNEGKQNLDIMTMKYTQLEKSTETVQKKSVADLKEERRERDEERKVVELEKKLTEYRCSVEQLRREKVEYERNLSLCNSEKEAIKLRAEQMMNLLQKMRMEE